MSTQERKEYLIRLLKETEDDQNLTEVEELLKKAALNTYRKALKPMTPEEYQRQVDASMKQYFEGDFISHEKLKQEAKIKHAASNKHPKKPIPPTESE